MAANNNQTAIIDYKMGNLFSVIRACELVGLQPIVSSDATTIMKCNAMILPGVGAFGDAMDNLKSLDLITPIKEFIERGKSFMGVCLGMQLLLSESNEFGHHKGLDIIKGSVVKFPTKGVQQNNIKVPQVGWNRIYRPTHTSEIDWFNSPFRGVMNNEYMYFVHSYYTVPDNLQMVLSWTEYESIVYASSILFKNVFACQFHPEKSSIEGMKIYRNFAIQVIEKENHE